MQEYSKKYSKNIKWRLREDSRNLKKKSYDDSRGLNKDSGRFQKTSKVILKTLEKSNRLKKNQTELNFSRHKEILEKLTTRKRKNT